MELAIPDLSGILDFIMRIFIVIVFLVLAFNVGNFVKHKAAVNRLIAATQSGPLDLDKESNRKLLADAGFEFR